MIGGKKRSTSRMNFSQERRAFWLRRFSDLSQSHLTSLKNHHRHPLRTIKGIVDDVLVSLDAAFDRLYEGTGRQSIAPERLLRASLLQAFYSVRSERQLMEQIDYNLLFRWFVGLGIDDPVWDHSTFSKNRDRLLDAQVAAKFLEAVLR